MLPDLHDLRDFHDEAGRLLDCDAGTPACKAALKVEDSGWQMEEPERHDEYLRRLMKLETEGKINMDGSWNP